MYLDFALTNRGMHELMFRHDLLESNELGLRDASLPIFSLLVDLVGRARPDADARLVAGALLANLYGIAQLWTWGSLQLTTGADDFVPLLRTALDAHLGTEGDDGTTARRVAGRADIRPHRRLTLASSVIGAVIVALDGTVLTIAQPTLQRDLDASFAEVQWTSTGYLIAVAGLLVFAGRLGDRYGHQRVFAWGVLGFGAASAGIGFAPGVGWVIGLRVVQGVFGALLQPATLGMLRAAFPPDRLGMPIALRTSAIGVAVAAGPLVGGVLVAQLGWRAVFFLNVVPALVMGLLALAVRAARAGDRPGAEGDRHSARPARRRPARRWPWPALVHTLVGVPEHGWTCVGRPRAARAAGAGLRPRTP